MVDVLNSLIAALHKVEDTLGISKALSDAATSWELPHYAYVGYPDPADPAPLILETYPVGWSERYLERRYDLVDPIVQKAKASIVPFGWNCHEELETANRLQRRFLRDALSFGIVSGFTIPIQDGARGGTLSFSCGHDAGFSETVQFTAHLAAIYVHQKATELCLRGRAAPKYNVYLTPREQQVLYWTGKGKTAAEAAKILGCTPKTIEFHLTNVREKFAVSTSRQAVALAYRYGLVSPDQEPRAKA